MGTLDTIFFDMDGTLLDTEKYYNLCWYLAITEAGYEITREKALELRSLGRPHVYHFFRELYGEDFPYDAIRNRRKEMMEEMLSRDGISLKPGVKELLSWLKEKKIRCMIATATDLERTRRYLEQTGILEYFDALISAVMVEKGKPSPDIYLLACEKAGRRPQDCIAVEDSPNGVHSAAAAGCRVFMVPDQTQPDAELRKECEQVFSSLSDMQSWLESEQFRSNEKSSLEL